MLYRSSPVGVVLARPSGERVVAKQADRSVTITGEPGELVLHGFGRDAVRVESRATRPTWPRSDRCPAASEGSRTR